MPALNAHPRVTCAARHFTPFFYCSCPCRISFQCLGQCLRSHGLASSARDLFLRPSHSRCHTVKKKKMFVYSQQRTDRSLTKASLPLVTPPACRSCSQKRVERGLTMPSLPLAAAQSWSAGVLATTCGTKFHDGVLAVTALQVLAVFLVCESPGAVLGAVHTGARPWGHV